MAVSIRCLVHLERYDETVLGKQGKCDVSLSTTDSLGKNVTRVFAVDRLAWTRTPFEMLVRRTNFHAFSSALVSVLCLALVALRVGQVSYTITKFDVNILLHDFIPAVERCTRFFNEIVLRVYLT